MSIIAGSLKASFNYNGTKRTIFFQNGRRSETVVPTIKCTITNTRDNSVIAETEISKHCKDRDNRIKARSVAFIRTLKKLESREDRKALGRAFMSTVKTDFKPINTINT